MGDFTVKDLVWKRVNANVGRIANPHVGQLGLFVIGLYPHVAPDQIDHLGSRGYQLTGEGMSFPNSSIGWSGDSCVGQIYLGYDDGGLLGLDISSVDFVLRIQSLALTFCRL